MRISSLKPGGSRLFLVLALIAGSVALVGSPTLRFSPHDRNFFADRALVEFVRPGLNITINSAQVTPAGAISVVYTITDPQGLPLDKAGITTPGPVNLSFIAAYIPQ